MLRKLSLTVATFMLVYVQAAPAAGGCDQSARRATTHSPPEISSGLNMCPGAA